MNKFKNYKVVKEILPPILIEFLYSGTLLAREVLALKHKYCPEDISHGEKWGDDLVSNAYAYYAGINSELLLANLRTNLEQETGLSLVETYSYTRIYENGQTLDRHSDRSSCEISITLNLGGDPWGVWLEDEGKDIEVILNPGDLLIYRGCDMDHWRNPYEGSAPYSQMFLHYNDVNGKFSTMNALDDRVGLGMPFHVTKSSELVKKIDNACAVNDYLAKLNITED